MSSSASYVVSFPLQTAVGNYVLTVGPNINDLYGQPMSQAYTNGFTISLPVIQGVITDTNSQPVAGVLLQPSAGSFTTTDTNGNYALGFVPGSSFTVTPSLGALMFLPGSMSYTSVSTSISNQNYLAVSTLAPVLGTGGNATNFVFNWQGLPGVSYQVYSSTQPYQLAAFRRCRHRQQRTAPNNHRANKRRPDAVFQCAIELLTCFTKIIHKEGRRPFLE